MESVCGDDSDDDDSTFIILFSLSAGINLLVAVVASTYFLMKIRRK